MMSKSVAVPDRPAAKRRKSDIDVADCEPGRPNCEVTLQLPLSPELAQGTVVPRHLETRLDAEQGAALRRVFEGLQDKGVRLANGRHVESYAQAIRYLLDEVAGELSG